MLKSELRNLERAKKREGVDMTYLKNVILKLLETGMDFKESEDLLSPFRFLTIIEKQVYLI